MVAEVVTLRTHTIKDIPAVLREIAGQLESGEFGAFDKCALVIVGENDIDVCLCGNASSPGDAHMILHAGMLKLVETV